MTVINKIRLSIIIPFYNVERFISRCLDSVYRQDIPEDEYEVICVDDCSPDDSISIVEAYAKKHPNLKIVRNKVNRKLGGARNAGMDVAVGNYIWFIDSDDFIEDNVLDVLCSTAEKDDLDVLHFNYENYPVRTRLHRITCHNLMSGPEMFFDKRFKWQHDLITAWRKLYRRSFLIANSISFAEHIMWEDDDYSIIVFARATRVRHIDLSAYYYCANPDSITRTDYNSTHISYWIQLSCRLMQIKSSFMADNLDYRFQGLIDNLIRFHIYNTFSVFKTLPKEEKTRSRRLISIVLPKLKGYISRKNYYSFLFRII